MWPRLFYISNAFIHVKHRGRNECDYHRDVVDHGKLRLDHVGYDSFVHDLHLDGYCGVLHPYDGLFRQYVHDYFVRMQALKIQLLRLLQVVEQSRYIQLMFSFSFLSLPNDYYRII